jgi:predicted dehydrogenase
MNTRASSRRRFLQQTILGTTALTLFGGTLRLRGADAPSAAVRVGVMGLGRGYDHVKALLTIPGAQIAYVCDVDQPRLDRGAKAVVDAGQPAPKAVRDFRRILEDPAVDALFIATPNFWHAPATILACRAGKHVYVEKPGSHNAREGELMVQAARKYRRVVQMGNQRRSWPAIMEGIQKVRDGAIGRVRVARCWYTASRPSIGRGRPVPPPATLDYALWQGPVPERPYLDNLVPYNWHWRWHWGGGELANNGIHSLDLARWGLAVEGPHRISCVGGRYHFDDDQETPDTAVTLFDYRTSLISFDHSSCHPRTQEQLPLVTFYGDQGSLSLESSSYKLFDPKGTQVGQGKGPSGDKIHMENFIDAIRSGAKLNSEIEEGQKSTLLCHLGNIAYRTGHTLQFDPAAKRFIGDSAARQLWSRQYRPGWEPKV